MTIMKLSFCRCATASLPFVGLLIGHFLDHMETERMTRFRGKSALYSPSPAPEQHEEAQPPHKEQQVVPEGSDQLPPEKN